jgi:hypothetical protein
VKKKEKKKKKRERTFLQYKSCYAGQKINSATKCSLVLTVMHFWFGFISFAQKNQIFTS